MTFKRRSTRAFSSTTERESSLARPRKSGSACGSIRQSLSVRSGFRMARTACWSRVLRATRLSKTTRSSTPARPSWAVSQSGVARRSAETYGSRAMCRRAATSPKCRRAARRSTVAAESDHRAKAIRTRYKRSGRTALCIALSYPHFAVGKGECRAILRAKLLSQWIEPVAGVIGIVVRKRP